MADLLKTKYPTLLDSSHKEWGRDNNNGLKYNFYTLFDPLCSEEIYNPQYL